MRQGVHHAVGAADCWGSGYVARRTSIDSINGIPLDTLNEDTGASTMLLGGGWKTMFVDEKIQLGRVPESFAAHMKQRTRWVSIFNAGTKHAVDH